MENLVLIDGNSILNRAFYGTMSSKLMMTEDGTYTNAIYGFLTIMFKIIEDMRDTKQIEKECQMNLLHKCQY